MIIVYVSFCKLVQYIKRIYKYLNKYKVTIISNPTNNLIFLVHSAVKVIKVINIFKLKSLGFIKRMHHMFSIKYCCNSLNSDKIKNKNMFMLIMDINIRQNKNKL